MIELYYDSVSNLTYLGGWPHGTTHNQGQIHRRRARVTFDTSPPCNRHRSSWATKTENNTDADPTRRFTFVRECKAKACFADAPGGRFVATVFGGPGLYGVNRPNRL